MPYDSPILVERSAILENFNRTRRLSEALVAPLSEEDCMLQSMPEASPVKWNLAHTSWFFETFILQKYVSDYAVFHEQFNFLFNSYYQQIGDRHPRPERGMISRPGLSEITAYRRHVNENVVALIEQVPASQLEEFAPLMALGFAHEEQHQELMLTDLKHAMFQNPLKPSVYDAEVAGGEIAAPLRWEQMEGGLCEIGSDGSGFSFDNEGPRHKVFLHPFKLANRPVTNGEYIEFIEDGGYQNPAYWLSDAWEKLLIAEWRCPIYWRKCDSVWREYTLFGEIDINPHAPVCHVSSYEAFAYAQWAEARLPTEFEWEAAASLFKTNGNFLDTNTPKAPVPANADERLMQLFGDTWEWTSSPYIAYHGYAPQSGAIGEYNGKFMSGQMVLRGGSCATPAGHIRVSYRNFFPPDARWQFSGFRLARDG